MATGENRFLKPSSLALSIHASFRRPGRLSPPSESIEGLYPIREW